MVPLLIFTIIFVFPVMLTKNCVSYVHQTAKVNSMPYSDLLSYIIELPKLRKDLTN